MKKGFRGTGTVERVDFPNKGIAVTDDGDRVIVKNTIPGQKVEFVVNKVKHQRAEEAVSGFLFAIIYFPVVT